MKGQAVEKRYGSDLTSIECQDVANSFFFFLTCCLHFVYLCCRPRCALVWGMVVRGFARRDLC